MNSRIRTTLIVAAALAVLVVGYQFLPNDDGPANIVSDIEPVRWASPRIQSTLDSLRGQSPERIAEILEAEAPNLGAYLTGWLRTSGRIRPNETISNMEYLFGSGEAEGEDANGGRTAGVFQDELFARITVDGRDESMLVAVRCLNGTFAVVGEDPMFVAQGRTRFTIRRGTSLVNFVPLNVAIRLAHSFGLDLIKGKGRDREVVGLEEALATNTATHQIRVTVYAGDTFDLASMVLTRHDGEEIRAN